MHHVPLPCRCPWRVVLRALLINPHYCQVPVLSGMPGNLAPLPVMNLVMSKARILSAIVTSGWAQLCGVSHVELCLNSAAI